MKYSVGQNIKVNLGSKWANGVIIKIMTGGTYEVRLTDAGCPRFAVRTFPRNMKA